MKKIEELLTEPHDDLHDFTNRDKETALVRQWLETRAGSPLPMQMFYGVGGSGKSMFVARLRQILQPEPLPTAFIDFNTALGSNNFSNDIPATLFEIARQLRVVCPRFELAYFRMLELLNQTASLRPGDKQESLLKDLTEKTACETFGKLAEAAEVAPIGIGMLVKLTRISWDYFKAPERQKTYREYRCTDEGRKLLQWLGATEADRIACKLNEFLALDLAQRLPPNAGKAARALIVFDTLEHLRRSDLAGRQQFTDCEQWIFELWKALRDAGPGGRHYPFTQIVLLGRDHVNHWEEYSSEIRVLAALEQRLMGGFSEADARVFLGKHQIQEQPLQDAILHSSLDVQTDAQLIHYHALSLGMLADTVATERFAGHEPNPQTLMLPPGDLDKLADRFLQSLHPPKDERRIVRLARTARFDEEALRQICSLDPDDNTEERRRILAYTFVQDAARAGWYVIHPRVRAAILAWPRYDRPAEMNEQHQNWVELWSRRSQRPDDEFASLAWLHRYQLDREEALAVWNRLIAQARHEVRMQDHSRLLD